MDDDLSKTCFDKGYELFKKYFEISKIRFTLLPIVDKNISINVPRGGNLLLLVCLHNSGEKQRRVGVKIEYPKRKGLKSTHLRSDPEEGKYWAIDIAPDTYDYIPFRIYTSSQTPPGEYKITISVWPSKARTAARAVAGIIGGLVLGRVGSALAKGAIEDEKIVELKINIK